jgi:bifunctional ADP-heptose synthase (sugar kinase/adenylyltransferase)
VEPSGGSPIVIVATDELSRLPAAVTMVDGGFDPLHPGHLDYFEAAAGLGLPVLCNISSDAWVARKHRPLLSQAERGRIIDSLRPVTYTHLSGTSTADVLRLVRPRIFAKGSDWRGRLPVDEEEACASHGIEVVFLDTVTGSSTALLERYDRARAEGG